MFTGWAFNPMHSRVLEGQGAVANTSLVVRRDKDQLDDLAQVLADAAVVLDPFLLAARRGASAIVAEPGTCRVLRPTVSTRGVESGVETAFRPIQNNACYSATHCIALLRGVGPPTKPEPESFA